MFAIWSAHPNWMPRKPKLMFQICQKLRRGFIGARSVQPTAGSRDFGHTRRVRTLVVVFVVASVGIRDADPCSISPNPTATIFQPASGKAPGRRPWIVLYNVKGPVRVASVDATCAAEKICRGTAIPLDRTGNFLRPKSVLAD